jgi:small-conductance mechanosensitive channel
VGINLSALFAAGALFAVALGFALQDLGQNLTAGITLLTERSIKPGDVLELDGRLVRVRHMGLRATVARTLDDEDIIVPNSALAKDAVINLTFRDSLYRVRAGVGVTYASDMKRVKAVLEEVIAGMEWASKTKKPVVLLAEFGNSSVDWEVSVWSEDPWRVRRHQSSLREAIWDAFAAAGIVIAFPQLDLHFDQPVNETLTALRPAS